jgi:hypothetical protein
MRIKIFSQTILRKTKRLQRQMFEYEAQVFVFAVMQAPVPLKKMI